VLVFTNQLTDPVTIGEYVDDSGGWYQEELDLTPYVGNVVTLVWYHTLLSFESAPRVGWLIDDVEFEPIVPDPTKVVAAPVNYRDHQEEMSQDYGIEALGVFLKAPSSVLKHDGVVRLPSWFAMTVGWPASKTATHEFVVPRSIPMILPMLLESLPQ